MSREISNLSRTIAGVTLFAQTTDPDKLERLKKIIDAAMKALSEKNHLRARVPDIDKANDFLEKLGMGKGFRSR